MTTRTATADARPPDEARILRLTRRFAVPVETLFDAWTDPAAVARWWGPKGMVCPVCELDLRVGGAWVTHMHAADDPGTVYIVGGAYREIDRPHRLAFTWSWRTDGTPGHETLITIDFVATDDGAEMRFVQRLFQSAQAQQAHTEGWTSALACLADYLGPEG